jgi:hypothetical protein
MVDPMLLQLIDVVERDSGALNVSLIVGGQVISGILIGEYPWSRAYTVQLADLAPDESSEAALLQAAREPTPPDGPDDAEQISRPDDDPGPDASARYLHLAAAEGAGYALRWRIRLADVSGWMLVGLA